MIAVVWTQAGCPDCKAAVEALRAARIVVADQDVSLIEDLSAPMSDDLRIARKSALTIKGSVPLVEWRNSEDWEFVTVTDALARAGASRGLGRE